jgi:hypothetical protein
MSCLIYSGLFYNAVEVTDTAIKLIILLLKTSVMSHEQNLLKYIFVDM